MNTLLFTFQNIKNVDTTVFLLKIAFPNGRHTRNIILYFKKSTDFSPHYGIMTNVKIK